MSGLRTFHAREIFHPLRNPYSGLVIYGIESCYGYREIPDYIYPASIVYLRPAWGQLEPEEGRLELAHFEAIRDRHLEGGAVQWAMRLVTLLTPQVVPDSIPAWVREAGAKGTWFGNGVWEPQYGDPVYQEKFRSFIQRIAERYDGDPRLAFVDISGLGMYSEWGDPHTEQQGWHDPEKRSRDIRGLIRIFAQSFRRTPLTISTHIIDPGGRDRYEVNDALKLGAWFRRDGVGSPFFHEGHKAMVQQYWEDRPIVSELWAIYQNYGKNQYGWSYTDALDQVLDIHAVCAEMSRDLDVTNDSLTHEDFDTLARKVGYRLVAAIIQYADEVRRGDSLILEQKWKNQGVAKLYVKHPLKVFLFDAEGREVWSGIDSAFDPTDWKRGHVYEAFSTFRLPPNIQDGTYALRIALVDAEGRPAIELGMEGDDGERRYGIGNVTVAGDTPRADAEYLGLNLARLADAAGHAAVVSETRPFHYVAPLNDGLLRVSVSDAPGDLHMVRQGFGILWSKERTCNEVVYYAGEITPGDGGWFERELWIEAFDGNHWSRIAPVAWTPAYPYGEAAARCVYTARFNRIRARGVRISGIVGRRNSKWVSVCEIEVYDRE